MARSLDRLVEARIREAEGRGVFDHLPGAGKPLPPDHLAWLSRDERFEALLQRSLGGPPEEVRLLREVADLREALAAAPTDEARARLVGELRDRSLRLSLLFEKAGRLLLAREVMALCP